MADAEALGIESINSFVNGIRRDLTAVKKQLNLTKENNVCILIKSDEER